MNSNEYRKRIEPLIELNNNLNDILSYVVSTIEYLESKNKEKYDVRELVMYLSNIPEIINEIKTIIDEYLKLKNF